MSGPYLGGTVAAEDCFSRKAIARHWVGAVRRYCAEDYQQHLLGAVVRQCRVAPGNRGIVVIRRELPHSTEFQTLTFWEDAAALRAFAEPLLPADAPENHALLSRKPSRTSRFDVLLCDVEALQWPGQVAPGQSSPNNSPPRNHIFGEIVDRVEKGHANR